MLQIIKDKLKQCPQTPGVYFHRDKNGDLIYVGKAARLKARLSQYFQESTLTSPGTSDKTRKHISEIADIEWQEVETELDALFLEAELIKRYKPKFNIDLRDDKSNVFIRIDIRSDHPTVKTVRLPQDDGAEYYGPYLSGGQIRQALRLLRPIYPYDSSVPIGSKRVSLDYHIGLSPGLEEGKTSLAEYRANLKNLTRYIRGSRTALMADTEKAMKAAARNQDFELATTLRNQFLALKQLKTQMIFGRDEQMDIAKDQALNHLSKLLNIAPPRRIECYDISHQSGTNNVASMVVMTSGISDRKEYRKFKMRTPGNDDFEHMREVMRRRFAPQKLSSWPKPDLLVIDGGKGQVSSVYHQLQDMGVNIPIIGLAKRLETVIIPRPRTTERQQARGKATASDDSAALSTVSAASLDKQYNRTAYLDSHGEPPKSLSVNTPDSSAPKTKLEFEEVVLGLNSQTTKLLQRIRDEAHRFAITYHRNLKTKGQTKSLLDEIPGIGPSTKRKLLNKFGSIKRLKATSEQDIAKVIGPAKAKILIKYLPRA